MVKHPPTATTSSPPTILPKITPIRLLERAALFDDPNYIFELKYDGFRAVAYFEDGTTKLVPHAGMLVGASSGQPFSALFTAWMISVTMTWPVLFGSAAAQEVQHGMLPRAMFTMVMISFTVTSPLPSQSPTQSRVVVGVGLGVGEGGPPVGVGAGLMGTAIMAQCGTVKLHDIVTVPIPANALPAPLTPALELDDAW